jgi:hypothetical protein
MKSFVLLLTAATWLTQVTTTSFAAEATPASPTAADRPVTSTTTETPESTAKKRRPETASDLTPEQRQARRKEMAAKREARIKALEAKQAAGTLSAKEKDQLTRLHQVRDQIQAHSGKSKHVKAPSTSATPAPASDSTAK